MQKSHGEPGPSPCWRSAGQWPAHPPPVLRLTEVGQPPLPADHALISPRPTGGRRRQQAPSGFARITSPIEFGQMFLASLYRATSSPVPADHRRGRAGLLQRRSAAGGRRHRDRWSAAGGFPPGGPVGLLSPAAGSPPPTRYLAAHGTPTSVAELAGHREVLLSTDSQRYWPLFRRQPALPAGAVLQQHHLRPRGEVSLGAGIAALPALIWRERCTVASGAFAGGRAVAGWRTVCGLSLGRRFQAMKGRPSSIS